MVAPTPRPRSTKPKLGDIVRDLIPELLSKPWFHSHKATVLFRISRCDVGGEGVVKMKCRECGNVELRPLSCQDRHCPSCGVGRAEEWVQKRLDDLLDVPYSHLNFPLPSELHSLSRANPEVIFGILFSAVQRTMKAAAAETLGGTPGFFCILHTATRRLAYVPHVHVLTPNATFDEATDKLAVAPEGRPLFSTDALADTFRDLFVADLRAAFEAGHLDFNWKPNQHLADPKVFEELLAALADKRWSVWLQPATPGPETTIRYFGRYIPRTAITNARIAKYDGRLVTYTFTDTKTRKRGSRTVERLKFVGLFAQHILPKGFQRVRYYGLFSSSKRNTVLRRAQAAAAAQARLRGFAHAVSAVLKPETPPALCCQACGSRHLEPVAISRRSSSWSDLEHQPGYGIPPPRNQGSKGRMAR